MGLGTKNRLKQTAELCKQHLWEKYPDKLALVEEFIVEIEGPPQNCDLTRWSQFTDIRDIKKEIFRRLELKFENCSIRESNGVDIAIVGSVVSSIHAVEWA